MSWKSELFGAYPALETILLSYEESPGNRDYDAFMCSLFPRTTLYSRLSLSRTRLSRITAYLEVKIWSLF